MHLRCGARPARPFTLAFLVPLLPLAWLALGCITLLLVFLGLLLACLFISNAYLRCVFKMAVWPSLPKAGSGGAGPFQSGPLSTQTKTHFVLLGGSPPSYIFIHRENDPTLKGRYRQLKNTTEG